MRTFIVRSLFLCVAMLLAVVAFFYLNRTSTSSTLLEDAKIFIQSAPSPEEGKESNAESTFTIPKDGLRLSTLGLGDSQRKALETTGINIDTFVLTEAMIACGVGKLGDARANKIFAGTTPTLIEIGTLLPCLKV